MLELRQLILDAMTAVEQSQQNGHVLGFSIYANLHQHEPEYIEKGMNGTTTHPLFECLTYPNIAYRLRSRSSASTAIESLRPLILKKLRVKMMNFRD